MKPKMTTSFTTRNQSCWHQKYKGDEYNREVDRINRKHEDKSQQKHHGTIS